MKSRFWNYVLYNYLKKIKSKAFIIFNVLLILSSILLSQLPAIISFFNTTFDYSEKIVIVDNTDDYYDMIASDLAEMNEDLIVEEADTYTDELEQQILNEDIIAVYELSYSDNGQIETHYTSFDYSNLTLHSSIEQLLNSYNMALAYDIAQLSPEQIELLTTTNTITSTTLDEEALTEDEVMGNFATAYFAIILIFMFSYMYSVYAGQEVMYEKTSRVMEIIVTSISPIKQLYGKIVYNTLYTVTQLGIIVILASIGLTQMMNSLPDDIAALSSSFINTETYTMIAYFILFTIVAYLMYLVAVLILSSIISSVEEYQIAISPIMIIGMAAFYIGIFGSSFVNSPFIEFMSYVPFFSVYIMPLRIASDVASTGQIWLCLGLNAVVFFLMLHFGANVYKNGVLNYSGESVIGKFKRALKRQ